MCVVSLEPGSAEVRKVAHYVPLSARIIADVASMRDELQFMWVTGRSRWTRSEHITAWKPTWLDRAEAKVRGWFRREDEE